MTDDIIRYFISVFTRDDTTSLPVPYVKLEGLIQST